MPQYSFEHVGTKEVRDIFYHMNDLKEYAGEDGKENGKWKRVWGAPRAAVDSIPADVYSAKDFSRVTNKKGVMADLWDRSAEMSAKRAEKDGIDHVKQKFYDDYSKRRGGKKHTQQAREDTVRQLKSVGINIDFGD